MKLAKQLCELKMTVSVGEARRKIAEGAVFVNSQKVVDVSSERELVNGDLVRIGRRTFEVPILVNG